MEHHPNYTWSAPPPSMLTNVRIPSDQIIESLGFLFNFDSDNNYNYYNNNNNNDLYWRNKLGQTYRPIKLETIGSNLPLLGNISRQNFIAHPSNKLFPYGQLSFIFNNSMNPKTNAPKMIIENKCSELLDSEENQIVFSLLGRKCITLSTAVVQLLITYPPDHIKWNIKCTGVACFVKDNPKRSYFIRIFDFENKSCVWEQELYNTFYYREVRSYFHTFEADNCMAGLNFSSDSEAHHFYETVIGKLSNRSTKRNERRANQNPATIQPTGQGVTSIAAHKVHESKGSNFKKKKDKNKKKILTKEDIGIPTNFQHVQHIGWNPQTNNFNVENVDAKLIPFLESAGVTQDQLNDEQTVKFIYNFLSKNGGFDKAIEEIGNRPPPPSVPPVAPSMLMKKSANSVPPPPPPPSVQNHAGRKQTMAPSVPIPPPPPPVPAFPAPGVTSNSVPPPPPPPPPPPSFNPSNSTTTVNGNNNQTPKLNPVMDSRSALMDQIRKGPNLNHVDPNEKLSHASPVERDDPRNQLLNQIRKGVDLKKIEPIKVEDKPTAESGGLAGALARALQERSRALNQTDDSDEENSDSTDEEWED